MKPNQRSRFNGRFNNGSRGPRTQTIFRNTSLESTGPCGKLRGTALQLHEKYLAAAKDAQIQNDDVLAETCYQYADHYMHVQNQAIANEQALHAQQQANRPTQTDVEIKPSVEVATDTPPTVNEVEHTGLKVVDLSVPVEAMNQQALLQPAEQTVQRPTLKPRRVLRPHNPKTTEQSEAATTEAKAE